MLSFLMSVPQRASHCIWDLTGITHLVFQGSEGTKCNAYDLRRGIKSGKVSFCALIIWQGRFAEAISWLVIHKKVIHFLKYAFIFYCLLLSFSIMILHAKGIYWSRRHEECCCYHSFNLSWLSSNTRKQGFGPKWWHHRQAGSVHCVILEWNNKCEKAEVK